MKFQVAFDSVILCLSLILLLRLGCTITTIWGDSMYPTLKTGDRLLVLNLFPRLWLRKGQIAIGKSQQLDELLFLNAQTKFKLTNGLSDLTASNLALPTPEVNEANTDDEVPFEEACSSFVKRVIGLPGDTVCISFDTLSEPMQALLQHQRDVNGQLNWVIPEKHCFVRGDGAISMDSLILGPIPLSALTGIAIAKLPPKSVPQSHPSKA